MCWRLRAERGAGNREAAAAAGSQTAASRQAGRAGRAGRDSGAAIAAQSEVDYTCQREIKNHNNHENENKGGFLFFSCFACEDDFVKSRLYLSVFR